MGMAQQRQPDSIWGQTLTVTFGSGFRNGLPLIVYTRDLFDLEAQAGTLMIKPCSFGRLHLGGSPCSNIQL